MGHQVNSSAICLGWNGLAPRGPCQQLSHAAALWGVGVCGHHEQGQLENGEPCVGLPW